ncbi:FecR family protein [Mucilaginibacter myungsuensis]|uniref:FecR domain-containing protein n=1 Tax=Mucilaginibacter myungsuensis TaxID=649104 RepID=A0A929KVQ7_9SPHI|nr:FecR family protein [Mucilaginibacter myungsuensis]MBE9660773.1 FecR domain-containing protein [Mucilaginibacter myungsuensis]MDN3600818.1 FecR domain-containing protein [Mucilaginibacter myungsuensis]
MTQEQYLALCAKFLRGEHTPAEEALIKQYQDTDGLHNEHLAPLSQAEQERLHDILFNKLQASMQVNEAPVRKMFGWKYAAAAAVLIFASAGVYFLNKDNAATIAPATPKVAVVKKHIIQPGSNKAILTLANGQTISLDDTQKGNVNKQGNLAISRSGNGIVINHDGDKETEAAALALNTISIPRGGKYNITLPDGTQVWLNSASSLTFPTAFIGNERKVTLTGEAYFEVAKNKAKPFKIDVNGKQTVEVLGTHFNINAYSDERSIRTTLIEGSVKVNHGSGSTLIKPGQMAVNNLKDRVTVREADVDEVMAWKNDNFIFNNENITSIMKKVSRWYDVDVMYKGDMSDVNFDGNYQRSKGLDDLLTNIELVNKVRFVTEGRRITVIAK